LSTSGPAAPAQMNLGRRVLTALVVLPPLLFANFAGPPGMAVLLVAIAALLGLFEFFALLRARGFRPLQVTGLVVAAAIFAEVTWPGFFPFPLWPLVVLVPLALTLARADRLDETIPAAAGTLLAALYLGALAGTMAALRIIEPVEAGAWRILLLFAIIVLADSAAFFVGFAVGRHRLAPKISPNKTVEGFVGGLLGGVLGAWGVRTFGMPDLPLLHALALGLLTAALGTLGDLDESLLKRWAGVKDSGTLFPGHGGMLDRFDSLLFGAPVLYYYFLYVA
jgi:phosphatidate cytidylyltransferase